MNKRQCSCQRFNKATFGIIFWEIHATMSWISTRRTNFLYNALLDLPWISHQSCLCVIMFLWITAIYRAFALRSLNILYLLEMPHCLLFKRNGHLCVSLKYQIKKLNENDEMQLVVKNENWIIIDALRVSASIPTEPHYSKRKLRI